MHADAGDDGGRICGRVRLDHHPRDRGNAAIVEVAEQPLQRVDQFATDGAADAARAERDDPVLGSFDQRVFERHLAELVEDHGGIGEGRLSQRAVDQRGLAGAERPGNDGEGDRLPARARHGSPQRVTVRSSGGLTRIDVGEAGVSGA